MNIVIINNLYGPYARGGAERLVALQAEELSKQGHRVLVVSTRPSGKSNKLQVTSYKVALFYPWNIISYYRLNKLPVPLRLVWHAIDMFNVHSYFKIKKILKRERPELVITHNLKGVGFLTPRAIKGANVKKHIHTLHDIQLLHPSGLMFVGEEKKIDTFFARIYQAVNKKLFASADIIISPSQWLLAEHERRNFFASSKKIVLRNPSHPTPALPLLRGGGAANNVGFVENRSERPSPLLRGRIGGGGAFVFLYAGQMEHHKGVHVLLEAFEKLRKDGGEAQLRLIGDGRLKAKLQEQAKPLGAVVTFLPWNHKTYLQELAAADCLVMPSVCYENSPTVIIDALAAGTPVIASDIGGAPELLEKGGGAMFKAGNAQDLARAMQKAVKGGLMTSICQESPQKQTIDRYIEKLLALC